ncbi:MAG TPA: lysylphosphatidylglycerol synthase transmembrane domain-containing protein, partial [Candidatus Brocadiales bacterium]|nr:lysylphosphatidylglycerol synthase transmembrane domain-containing protein [Candidatus Brocadiales bacterium]
PYLLQQNSKINFSSAMGTIILERILDSIFILSLFVLSINFIEVPKWIIEFAKFFALILLMIIALLVLGGLTKTRNGIDKIINSVFPVWLASHAGKMLGTFYSGISVIGRGRHSLIIILLSAAIWSMLVLVNWLLFRALDMNLGPFAAIYVLVLIMLGISVPAGPGFIGNYHYACVLALSFFGINKDIAMGYAIFLHVLSIGTILILGLLSLISSKVSISAFLFQKE